MLGTFPHARGVRLGFPPRLSPVGASSTPDHVTRTSRYAARPLTACNSECHRRRRRSVALSGDDGTRCNDSW
ncbi:hypothetical protein BD626DRAFT_496809 [Schizophyllum amplum]|uniref:Uncharacterized protein n=1 Tax=Schizophyllum amplum TaxID=97359 RepID=A0A550CDH6_9AGAR|nr:hypothetical protein BD626DRAFT_496809 [Auriculariopsis ampla]